MARINGVGVGMEVEGTEEAELILAPTKAEPAPRPEARTAADLPVAR